MDGRLEDGCWDGRAPLLFTTDRQQADEQTKAYLRADDNALYVGFARQAAHSAGKPVPWTAATQGQDAPVGEDDSINLRLRRGKQREG